MKAEVVWSKRLWSFINVVSNVNKGQCQAQILTPSFKLDQCIKNYLSLLHCCDGRVRYSPSLPNWSLLKVPMVCHSFSLPNWRLLKVLMVSFHRCRPCSSIRTSSARGRKLKESKAVHFRYSFSRWAHSENCCCLHFFEHWGLDFLVIFSLSIFSKYLAARAGGFSALEFSSIS